MDDANGTVSFEQRLKPRWVGKIVDDVHGSAGGSRRHDIEADDFMARREQPAGHGLTEKAARTGQQEAS